MIRNNNRRSSFGAGRKSWIKYAGITMALAVVCTLAFFALLKTDVFGKFEAKEPYVTGEAIRKGVTVTTEGSNQKGKEGSGATPCSAEVPTCSGKKGSETNPFVVLEIVPDKSQQQMIYLGQDDDSARPLDVMQIGIDFSKEKSKALKAMDSGMFESSKLGKWFFTKQYSVYKVGTEDEKEDMPFAYIDKLYTLEFTDEDVAKVSEDNTSGKCFGEMIDDIKELSDNYPKLFAKDSKGKKIRKIALDDHYNWEASKEIDEVLQKFDNPGYLLMVKPGEGEFGFSSYTDLRKWQLTKTGTNADRWIYVKDEAELANKYPDHPEYLEYLKKYDYNNYAVQSTKFIYKKDGNTKHADFSQEKDYNNVFDLVDSDALTGLVYKIDEWSMKPSLVNYKYTFEYYGVNNHNILKRSLFTFKDEQDYEDFHMEVICMTPAELNEISKPDTELTVDMIERADMYYIQSGDFDGSTVNETDLLQKLYYNYADTSASKPNENITFYENDLEWSLCQKIIQRQSSVKTLPLVFNQMVGELLAKGISRGKENETHMYVTNAGNKPTCLSEKGSRNNIAKLYLISIQFDLLARKENDEGLQRTFMEDIYPNIKTISLPNESGVVKGTATTTGYYDGTIANPMKLCTCNSVSEDFKKRVYYLWNGYTFFPQDMDVDPLHDDMTKEETLNKFYEQGYLPTMFDSNNKTQPFKSDVISHHSGSDGDDDKNVTIVGDRNSNSNTNHSSLLGNVGDNGNLANIMLEIIFQIMNNQDKAVHPVTVTAEEQRKMYVKIADDTVMIDHEEDNKLENDKDLYVKVRFWNNENNRSGQVKQIRLVKEEGGGKKVMKLYADKTFTKECESWKGLENQYTVSVDDAYLEGYIKFKLSDWKNGYNTLEFDTVGWIYYAKKGSTKGSLISGNVVTSEISIIGKTLFNLE